VTTSETLAERYGAASPWRRRALVAGCAAVAVAFLGWLVWTLWLQSTPRVTSQLETLSIDDDHTATAVLVVTLSDSDVRATCTLQALAEDHSVVGELAFTPDPAKGRRQVQEIRTERRATSVQSLGCTAPGQNRPR
jgi:hypothetical protein